MTDQPQKLDLSAPIERFAVDSVNIKSIGYSPELFMLDVEFTNNRLYRYFAVPIEIYRALNAAPSKGMFFSKHIKNNYQFTFMLPSAKPEIQGETS